MYAIRSYYAKTATGWEICPEGLHHFLTRIARDYTGALPLYITENSYNFV